MRQSQSNFGTNEQRCLHEASACYVQNDDGKNYGYVRYGQVKMQYDDGFNERTSQKYAVNERNGHVRYEGNGHEQDEIDYSSI